MNKISLYIVLIIIFLLLSKSFSPSIQGVLYLDDEKDFPHYFHEQPISLILIDTFQTGFVMKTYFQKYQIIHGFRPAEQLLIKTSKQFWYRSKKYLGMSLFRRNEIDAKESLIPMPPGMLFVGDPSFGHWEQEDSGQKFWVFHNAYKNFSTSFLWGDFKMTYTFYKRALIFLQNGRAFFGTNNEFGETGKVTRKNLIDIISENKKETFTYLDHLKSFFTFSTGTLQRNKSLEKIK